MELVYRKYGEGKPIIILHGLFGLSDNWVSIGKKLAENNFCVFIPDQRNHGSSPHSNEFDYPILSKDIDDFIKQHLITNPIVIGHSMGGKVAMNYALHIQNNIDKLIVVDMGIKKFSDHHKKILDVLSSVNPNDFFSCNDFENYLSQNVHDFWIEQLMLKNLNRRNDNSFEWKFNLENIKQNFNSILEEIISEHSFEKPTMFIRGELSDYINVKDIPEIKKIFPRSIFKTIAGASHLVHADKPKEFLETLMNFIDNDSPDSLNAF